MAERIVSPGVFTRERDLSFLPQGISEIGAAIIGLTKKGPAFTPTQVSTIGEFEKIFGEQDRKFYVPYAVESYLRSAGVVTIVRVLGIGGYTADSIELKMQHSSSAHSMHTNSRVTRSIAILAPSLGSNGTGDFTAGAALTRISAGTENDASSFTLVVSGSGLTAESYSLSFDTSSANFIGEVISSDPQSTKSGANASSVYVYKLFKDSIHGNPLLPGAVSTYTASLEVTQNGLNFSAGSTTFDSNGDASDTTWSGNKDFQFARTPYIISQKIGGTAQNLFRIYTRGHGTDMNTSFKIGILNVVPASDVQGSDFGKFDIQVRKHAPQQTDDDTIIEQFNNLTLDPTSERFFARAIGDRWTEVDTNGKLTEYGNFPNLSDVIRVGDFKNLIRDGIYKGSTKALVPMGYGLIQNPGPGGNDIPAHVTSSNQLDANNVYDRNEFYGFDFSNLTSREYLAPIASTNDSGNNVTMSLEDQVGDAGASELNVTTFSDRTEKITLSLSDVAQRKFLVPFQFGFDGINPGVEVKTGGDITTSNMQGFDLSSSTASGSVAFKRAINTISNPDEFDVNLVAMPGVIHGLHSTVTNHAISKVEARADAFLILDATGRDDTIDTVKTRIKALDTNYAATYYPWVYIEDGNTATQIAVPPSVVLPGVIAFNDQVAFEWFAPAGLNRGGLTQVTKAQKKLTHAERDDLYENRINPIASFPGQNIVVFGQKTLQSKPSALDRINIRRLLISLRKFIASTSRFLVFEQNSNATRQRFLNVVNPFLESVQQNSGLSAFRVVMDDTNNTPDVVDRNQLVGQIFIQPTRTAEFIVLDFVVQPTGAAFPE